MDTYKQAKQLVRIGIVIVLLFTGVISLDDKKCYVKPEVVAPDADVQFGLLLSLREKISPATDHPITKCGSILGPALEQYLAAEWLVNRLNAHQNGTGYIPGVKIGFQALDDCGSPLFASRNALTFLERWSPSFDQCPATQATPTTSDENNPLPIGFVGTSSSDIAIEVASATRTVPVPVISMAATKPELSDKQSYPTFLRTALSDEHQMTAITDMLQGLKWTYIAVIHINDSYGRSASESLARHAVSRGICIQGTLVLTSSTFSNDLSAMLKKSLGNSLAVVFMGSSEDADDLLYAIEKLGSLDGQEVKYGIRVILASSESSVLDSSVFDNLDTFGEGTLAVGNVPVNMSTDLEQDMQQLIRYGNDKHALIDEYAAQKSKTNLFQAASPNPSVNLVLHAVMALAEGLKTVHAAACGGATGPCQAMVRAVESGQLLKATREVNLDYSTMDAGVAPMAFVNKNTVVRFDQHGDITQPEYTIHQYRKQSRKYQQVGVYQSGHTTLQLDKLHWLTPAGHTAYVTPTSVCAGNCEKACLLAQGRGEMPLAIMPGTDGYIVGVFSIHDTDDENQFNCGDFRFVANDAIVAEGFFYAVKSLRNMTGLNFGAIGINDCYSPLRTLSQFHDLLSGLPTANIEAFPELGNFNLKQVVGVVACRSSGCTIPVASFFMRLNINVVSYAASSPDLDDKADFPYFLRTVPSDVDQAEVMLNIVKAMGWEYAGLLYVSNNYGIKAMRTFKKLAQESRIAQQDAGSSDATSEDPDAQEAVAWPGLCLGEEIAIEERQSSSDNGNFFIIWKQLKEQGVKVVVFFGIDSRYRAFLQFLEDGDRHGDFVFLASEEWAVNQKILQTSPRSARGAITLKVEEVDLEDVDSFRRHLSNKQPSPTDTNIWFSEFWQHAFQCNIPGGFINTFGKTCDASLKLSAEVVAERTNEQRLRHVMNAAYAFGRGLKLAENQLCEGKFPCPYLTLKASELTSMIRQQSRGAGSLNFPVFDQNGNGALGFDVYNVQKMNNGVYDYEKVATFNSRSTPNFDKSKLKFYTDTGQVMESLTIHCTPELCGHCPAPPTPPATKAPEPVLQVQRESKFKDADIITISLIGVLVLAFLVFIFAMVLCWMKYGAAWKKNMTRNEQIYDEPDRQAYQQYVDTHGFQFANLNIEPLLGGHRNINHHGNLHSPGAGSNYEQSALGRSGGQGAGGGGFHNEAYIHDHIDSVSQIISAGSPHHHQPLSPGQGGHPQPAMGTDMVRNRARSFQDGVGPSPSFSQRPLPVSPMGPTDTMSNIMHDNAAYHDALSDVLPNTRKMMSASGTPTHHSANISATGKNCTTPHLHKNSNLDAVTPSSCSNNSFFTNTSGATISSNQAVTSPFYNPQQQVGDQEPGIVYYMQDHNGQLTATRISQLPQGAVLSDATFLTQDPRIAQQLPSGAARDVLPQAPALMHQISQQSDQSSIINPDFGPYSQAAAVQKILQHLQQRQNQLQQYQLEQNAALHSQQHRLPNSSLPVQQHNIPPDPPTSQPPRSSIPRGSDAELHEMPGRSFFTDQAQHRSPTLIQQAQYQPEHHHYHQQQLHDSQYPSQPPPPPHKASQNIFRALSPPQAQKQPPHEALIQPVPVRTSAGDSHPSTPSTRRAAQLGDIPLTNIRNSTTPAQTSENPIMSMGSAPSTSSGNSEGYIDTAIGSSLSASPGVGLEAPVDLAFQPELSHDPRPPNDTYMESIDLSSAMPEVHAVSPASHRRGNNARPEVLKLAILDGKVSKV